MNPQTVTIMCNTTHKVSTWTIPQVLEEINRNRSDTWTPYDRSDWLDGWMKWVECDGFYTLISQEMLNEET